MINMFIVSPYRDAPSCLHHGHVPLCTLSLLVVKETIIVAHLSIGARK